MISPATLILSVIVLLAFAAFIAYGSGFHHGHVSGFHEGMDVAKDDIAAINADRYHWRTLQDTPRFPCRLIAREQRADGKVDYHTCEFDNAEQWESFGASSKEASVDIVWYDIRRIEQATA